MRISVPGLAAKPSAPTVVEITGRYTFPQILVDGTPIGGFDELKALDDSGLLDPLIGVA